MAIPAPCPRGRCLFIPWDLRPEEGGDQARIFQPSSHSLPLRQTPWPTFKKPNSSFYSCHFSQGTIQGGPYQPTLRKNHFSVYRQDTAYLGFL